MQDAAVEALVAWKGVVLFGWLAVLFAAERLLPAARWPAVDGPFGWRRLLRNGVLWGCAVAASALVVVPITAGAATLGLVARPEWWSGGWALLLDLLLLDAWIYGWHRANHTVPVLWRFHEIHHLDHFLDSTSALRFHYGELLLSALVRAPVIVLLGIPLESVLVFETLVLAAAIFHHANVRIPPAIEQPLSRVIVTPSIHWVHHHAIRRDTDSNYATILSLWDPLFGSRSPTRRTPDLKIGLENADDRSISRLLAGPLLPRRDG